MASAIPEAMALMSGSMVMTAALEESLPGSLEDVMHLYRCLLIYRALLSEEKPLAGQLICPTLQIRSGNRHTAKACTHATVF